MYVEVEAAVDLHGSQLSMTCAFSRSVPWRERFVAVACRRRADRAQGYK